MKSTHFQPLLLAGAFSIFAGTAFGQNNNQFPGNRPNMGGNMGGPNMGGPNNGQDGMGRAQMREAQLRTTLSNAGYTDTAIQDPIVELARMEQQEAQKLLPQINALRSALLSTQNTTNTNGFNTNTRTTNARNVNAVRNTATTRPVADMLEDYRKTVADLQEARNTAIADLDKTISFSNDPTLEALLTMLGIIGDETGFVSSMAGQAQLPGAANNRGSGNGGQRQGGGGAGFGAGQGNMNGQMGGNFGGMMGPPPPPDGE